MLTTFKASARRLSEGLQVETSVRNFKIILDEPKDLGGTDAGMNPVEALLCALGACQTIVATAFARKQNFKFDEVHMELEGDLDPDGRIYGARPGEKRVSGNSVLHALQNSRKPGKSRSLRRLHRKKVPRGGDCLANGVKLVRAGVVRE